jgi:hypothetical protein
MNDELAMAKTVTSHRSTYIAEEFGPEMSNSQRQHVNSHNFPIEISRSGWNAMAIFEYILV